MRYLVAFTCVTALMALPLSAGAQGGQEAPVVELQVDDAGVEVVPSRPRTVDGYTLEEMELRVKRAKIGLWSTAGATVLGGVIIGAWWACEGRDEPADQPLGEGEGLIACPGALGSGVVIGFSGAVGMIVTGALLGARKRKLRRFEEADYGTLRKVQWDLATSRFVF
jgi:hypothetical protein